MKLPTCARTSRWLLILVLFFLILVLFSFHQIILFSRSRAHPPAQRGVSTTCNFFTESHCVAVNTVTFHHHRWPPSPHQCARRERGDLTKRSGILKQVGKRLLILPKSMNSIKSRILRRESFYGVSGLSGGHQIEMRLKIDFDGLLGVFMSKQKSQGCRSTLKIRYAAHFKKVLSLY